jgi:hypothetical protein
MIALDHVVARLALAVFWLGLGVSAYRSPVVAGVMVAAAVFSLVQIQGIERRWSARRKRNEPPLPRNDRAPSARAYAVPF